MMKVFKIIVVGDSNVGKTSLTYRFCEGKFLESAEATIGVDFRERIVNVDGEEIKLQLWDTAGQERFRKSMVQHYYRNAHAVVIVYDVTKMSSFNSVPHWVEECDRNNLSNDVPRILVGNKCDRQDLYVVNTHMAQRLADRYNMPISGNPTAERCDLRDLLQVMCYKKNTPVTASALHSEFPKIEHARISSFHLFETSTLQDSECDNVEAIFLTLAHKLKFQKPLMPLAATNNRTSRPKIIVSENSSDSSNADSCC